MRTRKKKKKKKKKKRRTMMTDIYTYALYNTYTKKENYTEVDAVFLRRRPPFRGCF